MSLNLNIAICGGRLTSDPAARPYNNGTAEGGTVTKWSLAINRKLADKEIVTYVDCKAFGKTAENVAKYMRKGSEMIVEGRLDLEEWEDKATGAKRSRIVVAAERVQFGSNRQMDVDRAGTAPVAAPAQVPQPAAAGADDNSPPF